MAPSTPSNLSVLLGIWTCLWLAAASSAADEPATAQELAQLASGQQLLQAEVDERLSASLDAWIEGELGQALALRITESLPRQSVCTWRGDHARPPAMRVRTTDAAQTTRRTLHCTLRN